MDWMRTGVQKSKKVQNMRSVRRIPIEFLRMVQGHPRHFNLDKKRLIDYTYRRCRPVPASFADLGGVWNVDGAYTFYTLGKYGAERAFLVDLEFTERTTQRSRSHDNLELIQGNFGEALSADRIGRVDAVFLFDVLLHQVSPNWDELLEMYSERARYFVVYNQQWIGSEKTVRLIDLGRDEYFKNVPHGEDHPTYGKLFDRMYEIHPEQKRMWRDIHNVWQWGITDRDLVKKAESLGYKMLYYKNCGRFGSLANFENHGFVFQKTQ